MTTCYGSIRVSDIYSFQTSRTFFRFFSRLPNSILVGVLPGLFVVTIAA